MPAYQHGDATHEVRLEPLPDGRVRAVIDGRALTVEARPMPDGGWLLDVDGARVTAYTAAQGNTRYVYAGGQTFTLSVPDARGTRRRGATARGGDLTAQMPGQVIEVLARDGDSVERGQALVVLEAMKMELRVTAPSDGRVKRVLVKPGDVVERGQRLVEME